MALLTSNPPRIGYIGDGVTRTFTYNFRILAATDLEVYVAGVLKTHVTDYSVGNVDNANGGDVTFTVAATPANLAKILFIRATPATQEVVYPVGSKFPSTTHERVADKLTMLSQQRDEEIGRALKFPVTSTQKDKTVDDLVALKHLRVKADASGIDMVDAPTGTVSFPITTAQGGLGADVSGSAAEGDLLVRNAGLVFARLAKGATGRILQAGATTISWVVDLALDAAAFLGWSDLKLFRDAAGILAQRSGVLSQIFRLYHTESGGLVNYERLAFKFLTDHFEIVTEAGGTGGTRILQLKSGNGPVSLRIGLNGDSISPDGDNVHDLGTSGNRFRKIYVGGEVIGGTQPNFNYTFNGDFEIWGAGNSAAPTGWTITGAGATAQKQGAANLFKIGANAVDITRAGADALLQTSPQIHAIPSFGGITFWQGKTVTFGCWVRAAVAGRARIRIDDNLGTSFSSYHTGGAAFEFLTVTRALNAAITALNLICQVDTGDTTAGFDGAVLVIGSSVSDFIPSGWRGRTSMFAFGTIPAQAQGTTSFFGPWGWAPAENDARFQVPFKCVLRRLHAATNGNVGGAGQTAAFTVRKDAADTALTATINTGTNVAQDITNEVSYNANQSLVLKVILSATTGNLVPTATVVVEEIP